MSQVYTKRSIRNSLTNTEKHILENVKNVVKENQRIKLSERLRSFSSLKWDHLVYTFCILFNYLNYGMVSTIFAPAMVDMKFLYRTSMASINYGNTFSSAGYVMGSLTGFLYKYINRQMSFIVNIVIMGLSIGALPILTGIWLFYLAMFICGFGGGVFDSGNTVWVVEMWKDKSAPIFQLSQMMYGLGTIVAPLLVSPFIYGDLSNKSETTGAPTSTVFMTSSPSIMSTTIASANNTSDDDINYSVDRRSRLLVPFFVCGGLVFTIPILMFVMFFVKRYKIPEKQISEKKTENNNLATEVTPIRLPMEVSPLTRKILIALVALSLNSYSGLEITYFNYSTTYYQYLPVHLSASSAAKVMAVMTATYTAGRGFSAYAASKLRPEVMMTYHMFIIVVSYVILYFGQNSVALIYTGNALIGFGFSAMWPNYFAFAEKYMKLTDKVTSIFSFVSAFFALGAPFILGPTIENNPEIFLYVEFGMFSNVVILFIIMMLVLRSSQRYPVSYTLGN